MSETREAASRLAVAAGFHSSTGPRPDNQDYAGFFDGDLGQRVRYGVLAALADGVGGAKGGRVAAELAVRAFVDGYLGQSELIGVQRAGAVALEAANAWIHAVGRRDPELAGMASTFTALILRGRQMHVVHVGDSRLYRLRDERLEVLTTDHVFDQPGMRNVLKRAVGADGFVQIEYRAEATRPHDRFLLASDGVHGSVSARAIVRELARRASPDETARALVDLATAARTGDNATALVVDVLGLPPASEPDLALAIAALPIADVPSSGAVVNGFNLGPVLSDGRYSRVFRAHDPDAKQDVLLKFPKPFGGGDHVLRQAFLRETWIAARVRSPSVGEVIEISPERQTCLYSVQPFYEGETLEARLARAPPVSLAEGLGVATKLARGVASLHRAGIIHRDIKPDNVILESAAEGGEAGLKLVDLGVARVPNMDEFVLDHAPGTPSYMAPEMLAGEPGSEASDQYALGVTIFRTFTRAYPYGEVEPFSKPRFGRPASPTALRPDLPAWLETTLTRAINAAPGERYGDVLELLFDLLHGAARAPQVERRPVPLYARNPVLAWQLLAAALAVALFIALAFRR